MLREGDFRAFTFVPNCAIEHDAELLIIRLFVEVVRVSMLIASNEVAKF
jgi:hypothetical protein